MRNLKPLSTIQALSEGSVCGDVAHFPCLLPGQRNATLLPLRPSNCALILTLVFWELGSHVNKISRNIFSYHEHLQNLKLPHNCRCAFAFLCIKVSDGMGHFIHFTVNHHNIPSSLSSFSQGFHLLATQSGLVESAWTLIRSFVEQYIKISNGLILLLSHLVCQPEASRTVDTRSSFSNLSSSSNFLTQALASGWAAVSSGTAHMEARPLCSHAFLLSTAVCSAQFLRKVHWIGSCFQGIPVLLQWSTSIQHMDRPSPCKGQWSTQDFLGRCFFPKAHFFGILADSPIVSLQPQGVLGYSLKLAHMQRWQRET